MSNPADRRVHVHAHYPHETLRYDDVYVFVTNNIVSVYSHPPEHKERRLIAQHVNVPVFIAPAR